MSELLCCPFCGEQAFLDGREGELTSCGNCGARAETDLWNRRANRWSAFSDEELRAIDAPLADQNYHLYCELSRQSQAELTRRAAAKGGEEMSEPTELLRCNICGFVIDRRFEATKPTVDLGTNWKKHGANRWLRFSDEELEILTARLEGAALAGEPTEFCMVQDMERELTRRAAAKQGSGES